MGESKTQAEQRLSGLAGSQSQVSFCTNPMIGSGKVYRCRISEGGRAIVQSVSGWSGRTFYPLPGEEEGSDLGPVVVKRINGTLSWRLSVGHLNEGNG